jgi:hypothetical protein
VRGLTVSAQTPSLRRHECLYEEMSDMRLCYVLLSPTFGMHQYTADLANRMAQVRSPDPVDVHVVTTARAPHDRYAPAVHVHAPVDTTVSGFSSEALRLAEYRRAEEAVLDLHPDAAHLTGAHIWNVSVVRSLAAYGISVVHSLHDLDPHGGVGSGDLPRAWNRVIIRGSDQITVHRKTHRERLLCMGPPPE